MVIRQIKSLKVLVLRALQGNKVRQQIKSVCAESVWTRPLFMKLVQVQLSSGQIRSHHLSSE